MLTCDVRSAAHTNARRARQTRANGSARQSRRRTVQRGRRTRAIQRMRAAGRRARALRPGCLRVATLGGGGPGGGSPPQPPPALRSRAGSCSLFHTAPACSGPTVAHGADGHERRRGRRMRAVGPMDARAEGPPAPPSLPPRRPSPALPLRTAPAGPHLCAPPRPAPLPLTAMLGPGPEARPIPPHRLTDSPRPAAPPRPASPNQMR